MAKLNTERLRTALRIYTMLDTERKPTPDLSATFFEDYPEYKLSAETKRLIFEEVQAKHQQACAAAKQELIDACKELSHEHRN